MNPEDIPASNPAWTALRVTLSSAELAWERTLKRFIKLWVTRDPSITGRLFFFTVAGMSCIFGANVLGPENPLEFGRDNLFSSVMGGNPEWVFNREQGPVQPTLITSACACLAAIAKIRLGSNMMPLSPFMHGVLGLPMGFMLVFRWNNAYERWWSGRTELGLLLMHCKNLGGQFCTWWDGRCGISVHCLARTAYVNCLLRRTIPSPRLSHFPFHSCRLFLLSSRFALVSCLLSALCAVSPPF